MNPVCRNAGNSHVANIDCNWIAMLLIFFFSLSRAPMRKSSFSFGHFIYSVFTQPASRMCSKAFLISFLFIDFSQNSFDFIFWQKSSNFTARYAFHFFHVATLQFRLYSLICFWCHWFGCKLWFFCTFMLHIKR